MIKNPLETMFKILGLLLFCYVIYGLVTGDIYGRSGVWGKTYRRENNALGYWSAISAYILLTLALIFFF